MSTSNLEERLAEAETKIEKLYERNNNLYQENRQLLHMIMMERPSVGDLVIEVAKLRESNATLRGEVAAIRRAVEVDDDDASATLIHQHRERGKWIVARRPIVDAAINFVEYLDQPSNQINTETEAVLFNTLVRTVEEFQS